MERLCTIQRRENLNAVYRADDPDPIGVHHEYFISASGSAAVDGWPVRFQKGPRLAPDSVPGVLDTDLLEIVRDRLTRFQASLTACPENEHALQHVEEALMWLNKRVEDRIERGVLGTMQR